MIDRERDSVETHSGNGNTHYLNYHRKMWIRNYYKKLWPSILSHKSEQLFIRNYDLVYYPQKWTTYRDTAYLKLL